MCICVISQGISTYDYIVALREQEQQLAGGQQSPQMSPASSITGLSSASSFNTFHRGAWCTPPRLFVEDQVGQIIFFEIVETQIPTFTTEHCKCILLNLHSLALVTNIKPKYIWPSGHYLKEQ